MSYEFRNLYPPFTQHLSEWIEESSLYRNQAVYSRTGAWQGLYTPLTLEAGTYTFSVFVRTAIQRTVSIYLLTYGGSADGISPTTSGDIVLQPSADWQRISVTFTLSVQKELFPRVEATTNSSTKLYVSAPQLEVGSVMTLFEGYHNTWYIDGDKGLTHTNFPEIPNSPFQLPLPKSLWRINENINNGYPSNGFLPEIPTVGAFGNAVALQQSKIPTSVVYIGSEAFKKTALTSVTISQNCTYYNNSFPKDCTVNHYT